MGLRSDVFRIDGLNYKWTWLYRRVGRLASHIVLAGSLRSTPAELASLVFVGSYAKTVPNLPLTSCPRQCNGPLAVYSRRVRFDCLFGGSLICVSKLTPPVFLIIYIARRSTNSIRSSFRFTPVLCEYVCVCFLYCALPWQHPTPIVQLLAPHPYTNSHATDTHGYTHFCSWLITLLIHDYTIRHISTLHCLLRIHLRCFPLHCRRPRPCSSLGSLGNFPSSRVALSDTSQICQ